jgi:hypothetical protein
LQNDGKDTIENYMVSENGNTSDKVEMNMLDPEIQAVPALTNGYILTASL